MDTQGPELPKFWSISPRDLKFVYLSLGIPLVGKSFTLSSVLFFVLTMSGLFRSRHSTVKFSQDHHSPYSSLLDPTASTQQQPGGRARAKTSPADHLSRPWLATAENRSSWTGERAPSRKLVKDMNGSGPPSFSIELSDTDAEKEKGIVRRQIARLKELYRREK